MYLKSRFIEGSRFEKKFEKFKDIPFSFFFDTIPSSEELSLNPINIFAHVEPNEYFGHHDWLLQNKDSFSSHWGWYSAVSTLCEEKVWLFDDVSNLSLYQCLNHLSYIKDLNNEREKQMNKK